MNLALFDLDHTLIPFDSGNAFARFLIDRGVLDSGFEGPYLDYCRQYAAGTLDMALMHRFTVSALSAWPATEIDGWLDEFEQALRPSIPQASVALVNEHREAGHVCALVTATTRFIAARFARLLGLENVVATVPELDRRGHYTGEMIGPACYRAGKIVHVDQWLQGRGASLATVARSWFYSDSINDLALLERVTDPVVVNPDERLAALAVARGWPRRH